jgi:hypothetical protein
MAYSGTALLFTVLIYRRKDANWNYCITTVFSHLLYQLAQEKISRERDKQPDNYKIKHLKLLTLFYILKLLFYILHSILYSKIIVGTPESFQGHQGARGHTVADPYSTPLRPILII